MKHIHLHKNIKVGQIIIHENIPCVIINCSLFSKQIACAQIIFKNEIKIVDWINDKQKWRDWAGPDFSWENAMEVIKFFEDMDKEI